MSNNLKIMNKEIIIAPPTKAAGRKENSLRRENLLPVRYLHLRQVCSEAFFKSKQIGDDHKIVSKKEAGKTARAKICFVSETVPETGLHVEVVTPLLINQNRILKDQPVIIEVFYRSKPVYQWRTSVYWKENGRLFISELTAAVGRALRISHTCRVKDESEIAENSGQEKRQPNENNRKSGSGRIPRPAVERYL